MNSAPTNPARPVSAVLFDYGNTLVHCFTREEFPGVLQASMRSAAAFAEAEFGVSLALESLTARTAEQNHEDPERRVRPLEERLARIFGLDADVAPEAMRALCRAFLEPMFRRELLYPDALPTLGALKERGFRLGLVSNTPWGSPGDLWRERLAIHGLDRCLDAAVFCSDVGWRKPNAPVFLRALEALGVEPRKALFVGDDPRWDAAGPERLGMPWTLLDRENAHPDIEPRATTLRELLASPYTRAGE